MVHSDYQLDNLKRRFIDLESKYVSKIDNSSKIGMMAKVDNIESSYPSYSYIMKDYDESNLAKKMGVLSTSKVGSPVTIIDAEKQLIFSEEKIISEKKFGTFFRMICHRWENVKELQNLWSSRNGGRYKCLNGDKGEVLAALYIRKDQQDVSDSNDTQSWWSWITSWGSQSQKYDPYEGIIPILAIQMPGSAESNIIMIEEQGVKFDGSFPHGLEWKVGNTTYIGDFGEVIAVGKKDNTEYIAIRTDDDDERDQKIVIIASWVVTYITKAEYEEEQVRIARIQNWNDDFEYRYPEVRIDPDAP